MPNTPCPCQSHKPYAQCCQRWHQGDLYLQAPDAEQLMRSRYSAFVLDLLDYLLATWHPSTRPTELEPNPTGGKWLGLEIKKHLVLSPTTQQVEFVARHRLQGKATRLHEISQFVLENNQWLYVDGSFIEK